MKRTLAIAFVALSLVACGKKEPDAEHTAAPSEPEKTQPAEVAELEPLNVFFMKEAKRTIDDKQYNKAMSYLIDGIELGDREALDELDRLIRNDPAFAILDGRWQEWLLSKAYAGLKVAQLDVAKRFLAGDGLDRDLARGYAWFLIVRDSDARLPDDVWQEWRGIDDALPESERRRALVIRDEIAAEARPTVDRLKYVSYFHASAAEIPMLEAYAEAGKMPRIQVLVLHSKDVTDFPSTLAAKLRVNRLVVLDTSITELPENIGNLTDLQMLMVMQTPITELPPSIGNLKNLQFMGLNETQITGLPPDIRGLDNLAVLNLRQNKISMLPREVWSLPNLRELDVAQNFLVALPPDVAKSPNLERVYVTGNPLIIDPTENMNDEEKERVDIIAEKTDSESTGVMRAMLMQIEEPNLQ